MLLSFIGSLNTLRFAEFNVLPLKDFYFIFNHPVLTLVLTINTEKNVHPDLDNFLAV